MSFSLRPARLPAPRDIVAFFRDQEVFLLCVTESHQPPNSLFPPPATVREMPLFFFPSKQNAPFQSITKRWLKKMCWLHECLAWIFFPLHCMCKKDSSPLGRSSAPLLFSSGGASPPPFKPLSPFRAGMGIRFVVEFFLFTPNGD